MVRPSRGVRAVMATLTILLIVLFSLPRAEAKTPRPLEPITGLRAHPWVRPFVRDDKPLQYTPRVQLTWNRSRSWNPPGGEMGPQYRCYYQIEYRIPDVQMLTLKDRYFPSKKPMTVGGSKNYRLLRIGEVWTFRIRAVRGEVEEYRPWRYKYGPPVAASPWSNWVTSPTTPPRPSPPHSLVARVAVSKNQKRVILTWRHDWKRTTGFRIERKQGSRGEWKTRGYQNVKKPYYHDYGILPGKVYYYRVFAYAYEESRSPSNEAHATAPARDSLPAPIAFRVTGVTSSTITLSWINGGAYTKLWLERLVDGGRFQVHESFNRPIPKTFTDEGLRPATRYSYRLRGDEMTDEVKRSSEFTVIRSATTKLLSGRHKRAFKAKTTRKRTPRYKLSPMGR